jgi:YtkA-like
MRFQTFIACAAISLGVGCQRPVERPPDLKIEHEITPRPLRVGPVTVTLAVTDGSSKPVSGVQLKIEADMSHPGMRPVFADAAETKAGRYQAHLSLGMAGDWIILVHGTLPGGKKLERQFEVSGVQPN